MRMEAKRKAVEALAFSTKMAAYDTNHDTSDPVVDTGLCKLLENMVGPNGLEPSTSSVSRKRSNQTELRA